LLAFYYLKKEIRKMKSDEVNSIFVTEMLDDFLASIASAYSKLPQETLIAALLDPRYALSMYYVVTFRFKHLPHVPVEEHAEARNCLLAEFHSPAFFDLHNRLQDDQEQQGQKRKRASEPEAMDIFDMFQEEQEALPKPVLKKDELTRYVLF
jgi:hypothetical protein